MKIRHLTYFIMLNFINQRAYFQRISYNFNEVLVYPNLLNYLSLINKMIHIYISKNKTSIKNKGLEIVQLGRTLDHIH